MYLNGTLVGSSGEETWRPVCNCLVSGHSPLLSLAHIGVIQPHKSSIRCARSRGSADSTCRQLFSKYRFPTVLASTPLIALARQPWPWPAFVMLCQSHAQPPGGIFTCFCRRIWRAEGERRGRERERGRGSGLFLRL